LKIGAKKGFVEYQKERIAPSSGSDKRSELLRHLRRNGCTLKCEGASHSLWINTSMGQVEAIPRHTEIPNLLAKKICRGLSIPER